MSTQEQVENSIGKCMSKHECERNGEHRYMCPLTGCEDKKGHMYINYKKKKFTCFKCGCSGPLNKLLEFLGIDKDEDNEPAPPDLDEQLRARLLALDAKRSLDLVEIPPCPKACIPKREPLTKESLIYLKWRKFPQEKCKTFKLETVQYKGERIFVPCYMNSVMTFWTARSIYEDYPKYENPHIRKSLMVFNYDLARSSGDYVIITEGPFSAMRVGEHAVALYGKTCSDYQFYLLVKAGFKKYYIALDGDAKKEGMKLFKKFLAAGKETYLSMLPDGEDPDTFPIGKAEIIGNDIELLRWRLKNDGGRERL